MKNLFIKTEQPIKGGTLLKPLIKIRGHQCECCDNTLWLDNPIPLQVHHKDGDRTNNTLENLMLLCLNCHALTNNFGIKNKKTTKVISEKEFVEALKNSPSIRQALFKLNLSDAGGNYNRARQLCQKYNINFTNKKTTKINKENYCKNCGIPISFKATLCISCNKLLSRTVERPSREELKYKIRNFPFTQIGKEYNVSDKAIVKWCISEGLPHRKRDIKLYSDKEWEKI